LFEGCCQWWNNDAKRVGTLEFDRTRKSMGVIVKKTDSGKNLLLVKVFGIIHVIYSCCKLVYVLFHISSGIVCISSLFAKFDLLMFYCSFLIMLEITTMHCHGVTTVPFLHPAFLLKLG
jgi:hypothetical protein